MKNHHAALFSLCGLAVALFIIAAFNRIGIWGFVSSCLGAWLLGSQITPWITAKVLVWWQPEVFAPFCRCKTCKGIRAQAIVSHAVEYRLALFVVDLLALGVDKATIVKAVKKTFPEQEEKDILECLK